MTELHANVLEWFLAYIKQFNCQVWWCVCFLLCVFCFFAVIITILIVSKLYFTIIIEQEIYYLTVISLMALNTPFWKGSMGLEAALINFLSTNFC